MTKDGFSLLVIGIGGLLKLAHEERIDIGRNKLFQYLRKKQILINNNLLYQRYLKNGWFEVAETAKQTPQTVY